MYVQDNEVLGMDNKQADEGEHTPDVFFIYIWTADVIQVPRTYLFSNLASTSSQYTHKNLFQIYLS